MADVDDASQEEPLQRDLFGLRMAAAEAASASILTTEAAAKTLLMIELERLRDPERALGIANRACELEKDNWQLLSTLALAQHMTGDSAVAVQTQKRVMAWMPEGADSEMAERMAEYEARAKGK